MDTILVLMQVGREGDWSDRGLPEVVSVDVPGDDPHQAGIDWVLDNHPQATGDDWRLLVWAGIGERAYHHDEPTTVVTPADYRAALAGPAGRRRAPRTARRRPPRVDVAPGRVVHKEFATEHLLGRAVLLTQDQANTWAHECAGPWYPAHQPGPDVVAARVRQFAELERPAGTYVRLGTTAGDVGWMPVGTAVIPADED